MFVAVLLFLSLLGSSLCVDLTLSPNADGKIVVNAVIDRIRSNCIFGDDRLFLRRLAFVETEDGKNSKTYRSGYHGGIWQIDEAKFNMTKQCSYYRIRNACELIQSQFNINWTSATWQDLRKPLYSGIAASLFIQYWRRSPPATVSQQAYFWANYMRSGGRTQTFIEKAGDLPGSECSSELDLAFIVDGSGSVSHSDFYRVLTFIGNVVDGLTISDEEAQVALLEYSTTIGDIITFDNYTNTQSLKTSIAQLRKSHRGTNTALAIQTTLATIFNTTNGARPNAKRVSILITDGRSANRNYTEIAAEELKDAGITLIVVGVGNVYRDEIYAVATKPNCTHVIYLNSFSEIDSLLYTLKESSCEAPTHITEPGTDITKNIPKNETVKETYSVTDKNNGDNNDTTTTTDGDKDKQTVVRSEVTCGTLEIYASYSTSRPGPAFYDIKDSAREGHPSIIYLNVTHQGRPLYLTIVAARMPEASQVTTCVEASYQVSLTKIPVRPRVVCMAGETEVECTKEDLRASQYSEWLCEDSDVVNPCQRGYVSMHAHPSDLTKFIRCDVTGKMYITQCPGEETYNAETESCGHEAIEGGNSTLLPTNLDNHCTAENLAAEDFYHPHPEDRLKYIQCDVWGRAWVKPCPDGLAWDDPNSTCNHPPTPTNPCNSGNTGSLFSHANPNKFIMCSNGIAYTMSCQPGLVFNGNYCDWPQG